MDVQWKEDRFKKLDDLKVTATFRHEGQLHMKVWPTGRNEDPWISEEDKKTPSRPCVVNVENGAYYGLDGGTMVEPIRGRFVEG